MGYKIRCQVVRVFLLENFRENIVDKEAFQKIIKRDIIPADVLPNNSEALLNYSGLLVGFFFKSYEKSTFKLHDGQRGLLRKNLINFFGELFFGAIFLCRPFPYSLPSGSSALPLRRGRSPSCDGLTGGRVDGWTG